MTRASAEPLVALLNGKVLPVSEPLLRPDDAGVVRGDGVFETTLAVDGVPRDVTEHLARLDRSAAMLNLAVPGHDAWRTGLDALLADEPAGEWSVRLTATRGPEGGEPTCFLVRNPVSPVTLAQRAGIRVLMLPRGFDGAEVAAAPWLLSGAKTLSYAMNMAALRYAAAHGADDVIFLGRDGALLEAPTATLVIANDRTLLTPPSPGILDGITARRLFAAAAGAGWTTTETRLTADDLRHADAIWLTSSVRLLAPIIQIDGRPPGSTELTTELAGLLQVPGGAG